MVIYRELFDHKEYMVNMETLNTIWEMDNKMYRVHA